MIEAILARHGVSGEPVKIEDGKLSGLFDFEPAMVGAPEYDLAAIGIFVTGGEPGLGASASPQLLFGHALVHRYSHLEWYLERMPAPDLAALAELGWGVMDRP